MTVKNLEIEEAKEKRREVERKKLAEERKKYTLSMIEKDAKKDFEMERDENALLGKIPISSKMSFRSVYRNRQEGVSGLMCSWKV